MDTTFLLPIIQDCVVQFSEDVSNDLPGASTAYSHHNLFGFNFKVDTTSQARELAKSYLDLF